MKKFIVCLFIGLFLLIGNSFAETCSCCGGTVKRSGSLPVILKSCPNFCSSLSYTCSKCGKCSRHCTCCKCCGGTSGSCGCYNYSSLCSSCGKCLYHCTCSPSSTSTPSSSHTCSFLNYCSKTHCYIKVCSDCGKHKNDATCGGGCNTSGYCKHCSVSYCSICNSHTCRHNSSGYCSKPHCTSRSYCTKCGHSCNGDHEFTKDCGEVHCTDKVCSVSGCNVHKSGACGEGHTNGKWLDVNGKHTRYCGRTDLGCNVIVDTHTPVWGTPNANHISTCMMGCNITSSHEAKWGEYFSSGDKHLRRCTIVVGESTCKATDSHNPDWSEYQKSDGGGEESGASHLKRCNITDCKLTGYEHRWFDDVKWISIDEQKHKRVCPTCNLTQVLEHNFIERVAINGDIEKHYKVCDLCFDGNDSDNKYKTYETHVDAESSGRGNGICDLCNKELWKVTKSIIKPTREDVVVTVEMFSDYTDKIINPVKMMDEYGNEFVNDSGNYTIEKNGKYTFVFECPDRDVIVDIDNISKNVYGKVFITPDTATTGEVTLKLVTSTEGIDKTIDVMFEGEEWKLNTLTLEKVVSSNGKYTFYARDSLDNYEEFVVNVDNIVSGFGSVTTTFDVFQNGYIFTDILVNVNQAWISDDMLINCLDGEIYKYKVDGNDSEKSSVSFNKVQIIDSLGNKVTDNILESGTYYLRVAIGGAGVFTDVGTYMIEIKDVTVKKGDNELITLSGKNRIEVVVQSLNDLT